MDPLLPLFAIMECHSMTQSYSTFAIKYFWQILNMICNFAKLVVVDPYMLCFCYCHDSFINMPSCCRFACFLIYCFMVSASSSPRCLLIIVSAMLCFLQSLEPGNETCYVYMLAIISSVPFCLMVSKGLLFYAFSRFMPCLVLLW